MAGGHGDLQCVGKMEIAKPTAPLGFLCGTLPVPTDSAAAFPLFQSAPLLPSPPTIGAPPRYQMLPAETDLNALPVPPNLPGKVFPATAKTSEEFHCESSTVSQNLFRKCEALAVSGLAECGDELDVVASTDILKQIFKIPYSKAQLSIAVHRIGDTLILNTGPDVEEGEKAFRRQSNQPKGSDSSIFLNFAMHSVRAEACDCPPGHQPSSVNQSSSTILPGHLGHRENSFVSSTSQNDDKSQFLRHTATISRKSSQGDHDEYSWHNKQTKKNGKRVDPLKKSSQYGEKPRFPVQESDKLRRVGDNGFLKVLFWQFHNFRMLLGSDLLLFSNEKYAAVSLHLWDVSSQVTPLAWLEAWLDNVMATVPELAICYHQNGVVQGYELIKTDDIFLLKGVSDDGIPAFHPHVVQQNGLSVLRFLQDNCKQDPAAYWLYKGAGEDVIQLFDLSVISEKSPNDDLDKSSSSLPSILNKGRRDSLFSLGTLLYRVAHRLSLSKAPDNRVKCAKFFKKCLNFLSEQDHLVVRAYAHEQFARLILNCYEELELLSESYLLESEITVTDLEDETSEFPVETFASKSQQEGSNCASESAIPQEDEIVETSVSDALGMPRLEADVYSAENAPLYASDDIGLSESKVGANAEDSLLACHVASSPSVVTTIADPISSKLVAIHHVSQAIKSLRWKRQLQNTQGELTDFGNKIYERTSANFSCCTCGDRDCIEVCDIREWLPKSKIDHKMWKLVLLLGESYLSLGEAYKEDGQLRRTLKVVELACLLYGSMPQYLEDAQFISSMIGSSSCQLQFMVDNKKTNLVKDGSIYLDSNFFQDSVSDDNISPTYFFWVKAWTLVGDVYVEYHRTKGKDIPVKAEINSLGSEVRMSNEVVKEVKRLKKKLRQYRPNCSTCSLMNCSCQTDRANSGNSASSSSGGASSVYSRKHNRKLTERHSSFQRHQHCQDVNNLHIGVASTFEADKLHSNIDRDTGLNSKTINEIKENSSVDDIVINDHIENELTEDFKESTTSELCYKDSAKVRNGGIFKFLEGPKYEDVEYNLSVSVDCYRAASDAMNRVPIGSAEYQSVMKKIGWATNELGRYRLENKNLIHAEVAFLDAIKAFKQVSDHTNVILINCNLGHGRRAVAEELVFKTEELKKYEILQNAYKQTMKSARTEYAKSLKYYNAAMTELKSVGDELDIVLRNEVCTQYAHTYLRFGMLLAKERTLTDSYNNTHIDELLSDERFKEEGRSTMSASDAFREALLTYESLGELRKQEAAFARFQLACYYRDSCLKILDLDHKQVNHPKSDSKNRQKAKWYASLAEKNWQKALGFYSPKSHPIMYLNILMEQSALSMTLSSSFLSNTMLEAALALLLEGRHVVEVDEVCPCDDEPVIKEKFWSQLQVLLKNMVAASLSLSANRSVAVGQALPYTRAGDSGKLKEMYRMSLKSTALCKLHVIHKMWMS